MRKKNWDLMYREQLPPGLREAILNRDDHKCQLCGYSKAQGATLEVDHIIPVAANGTNDPDNLWTLCQACNRWKGDRMINERFLKSAVQYNYMSTWDTNGNICGIQFPIKEKWFNRLREFADRSGLEFYDLICFIFRVYIPDWAIEVMHGKKD